MSALVHLLSLSLTPPPPPPPTHTPCTVIQGLIPLLCFNIFPWMSVDEMFWKRKTSRHNQIISSSNTRTISHTHTHTFCVIIVIIIIISITFIIRHCTEILLMDRQQSAVVLKKKKKLPSDLPFEFGHVYTRVEIYHQIFWTACVKQPTFSKNQLKHEMHYGFGHLSVLKCSGGDFSLFVKTK